MVRTLERIATDPKTRRAMEEEEFAALDTAFLQNAIKQKEKVITQKDYIIAQKEKENAELRRLLGLN